MAETMNRTELLTVKELPFPRTTVWRLLRSGKLSHYRIGRRLYFSPAHVEELLRSCEQGRSLAKAA